MKSIVVDIADMAASDDPDTVLVTYSLGSCLGVTLHDPVAGIAGMAHFMLPLARIDPVKAGSRPFMYVDTGMIEFLTRVYRMGARKDRCTIKVAGGSQVLDKSDLFRIGHRNLTVLRKVLWKNGLMIAKQDTGGSAARTMRLETASGRVTIKSNGGVAEL